MGLYNRTGRTPIESPETVSLYNGSVLLTFDPRKHKYTVLDNGKELVVPSVTTICGILDKSGPLIGWAAKTTAEAWKAGIKPNEAYSEIYLDQLFESSKRAHREIKAQAADIGTQVHQRIEHALRNPGARFDDQDCWGDTGEDSDEGARVRMCLAAAKGWLDTHNVQVLAVEKRIYSRKYGFSGTMDMKAIVDGQLSILDWKSSKNLREEYRLQVAAYKGADEEETGEKIQHGYIIRLGKDDGAFEVQELTRRDLNRDWKGFKHALGLWEWRKQVGG